MPSVEAYIGSPIIHPVTGEWDIVLDTSIQINLDSIGELVLSIFDADACVISANFSQGSIILSQHGQYIDGVQNELFSPPMSRQFNESVLEETAHLQSTKKQQTHKVHSPITFPSGLEFGMLTFERQGSVRLSEKEKAILNVIQRDITNHLIQHKQVFEAAKSNELQTLISKHNQDWIFVKDENFRIVYANDAFLKRYPKEIQDKIIGFTTVEEYDAAEAERFLAQDKQALEQGFSKNTEELHMPDGSHIIVESFKRRFEDEYGKPYLLGVSRDITEKEGLIRKLKKANDELDDFTSIASHDLKSPLNAIKRLLEWIEEDCKSLLPEEHVENLQLAMNRANRMQALLDDLFRYAKINSYDVSLTTMNLTEINDDIVALLDVPDTFTVRIDDGELTVPAVPFQTVMLNLIGNAIKHHDKAYGIIDVTLVPSKHYYVIEVSDNGPGIEAKYFDRIFQLFQTLRSRDEVEGSGIGLSVVMKHINNFGGKIEVESDGKLGCIFRVYWPKPVK